MDGAEAEKKLALAEANAEAEKRRAVADAEALMKETAKQLWKIITCILYPN
jgi:hypothetical protein